MAKQAVNGFRNGHEPEQIEESHYTIPDVITTSRGVAVRLIGLNPARMEKLQTAGKTPSVPTREIPNDLGDPQKEYLSADDLQTDEEKQAWADYLTKRDEIEKKRNENVMKYIFTDGFEVDMSDLEEWKQLEQDEYGIELPTSPIQLKIDYINAKVIGTAADLGDIMAGVLERTGLPATMLDEVRDSFGVLYDKTPLKKLLKSDALKGKWSWNQSFTYGRVIHYFGIWPPSKFWDATDEDRAWAVAYYETEMGIQAWDSHVSKMKQEAEMSNLKNRE